MIRFKTEKHGSMAAAGAVVYFGRLTVSERLALFC